MTQVRTLKENKTKQKPKTRQEYKTTHKKMWRTNQNRIRQSQEEQKVLQTGTTPNRSKEKKQNKKTLKVKIERRITNTAKDNSTHRRQQRLVRYK